MLADGLEEEEFIVLPVTPPGRRWQTSDVPLGSMLGVYALSFFARSFGLSIDGRLG